MMRDLKGTEYNLERFIVKCNNKKIVIFGAGQFGTYLYDKLVSNNIKVYALCDNNEQHLNDISDKYPTKYVSELIPYISKLYFIIAVGNHEIQQEIKRQLLSLGVKPSRLVLPIDASDTSKIKLSISNIPYFAFRLEKWLDKYSKVLFRRIIKTHNNYIVLESEGDYTDNVKVFYDYMINHNLNNKYKIIWMVHNPKKYKKENNVKFVSRWNPLNLAANYYVASAKYFIFSHPYWLKNWKKDQIVINTSHSIAILKYVSNKEKTFNYVLSCSEYCTEMTKNVFGVSENNILCIGMPRIDLLYHDYSEIKKISPGYNGQKIILSVETFKQSYSLNNDSSRKDMYAINVVHDEKDLFELDNYLSEINALMIVKIHHLQNMRFIKMKKLKNIIYINDNFLQENNIVLNQLLTVADIMLTDYSSVFYDYLVLNRPIGFLISDINEYTRGFLMENPLDEMPGEKIHDLQSLKIFLSSCINGKDTYENERANIRKKVFVYNDDKNSERLFKWISSH